MAHDINEKIREYENEQRVISIGRRLFGKEVPPIAVPGRKCVPEWRLFFTRRMCVCTYIYMFIYICCVHI